MLTKEEIEYLKKIPQEKRVVHKPFDPKTPEIVTELVTKIKSVEPNLEVIHLGASSLGISGQGDIDLSILCAESSFSIHAKNLEKVLGKPVPGKSITFWHFNRNNHEVEIYLADPNKASTSRQLEVHEILKNNSELLNQYQQLKESYADQPYREYQRQKYEFYNKILAATKSKSQK